MRQGSATAPQPNGASPASLEARDDRWLLRGKLDRCSQASCHSAVRCGARDLACGHSADSFCPVDPGLLVGGKYRLLRKLGGGAMGVVWAARNELTRREFALKLITKTDLGSEEAQRRLLREATSCGQLVDRTIVELYDVGVTDAGDPFLVMELLNGETLSTLLDRQGMIASHPAAMIAAPVARALRVAHAAGVIHRDLKPTNIFLHEDPDLGTVVKVLDFGISKVIAQDAHTQTATGTALGSPAYMSPEQARGAKALDHRTDLWSFGVVLFEMLTGRLPFEGPTPYAVVSEIMHGVVPRIADLVPDADPRLVELVERCLQRDPEQRIGSALEIVGVLKPIAMPETESGLGSNPSLGGLRLALSDAALSTGRSALAHAQTARSSPRNGETSTSPVVSRAQDITVALPAEAAAAGTSA